jgi:hypothetical protein
MDEQDEELNQDIHCCLRTLIRELTQNNGAEMYEAWRGLIRALGLNKTTYYRWRERR